ncbi:MAG: hypothetical protein PVI57_08745, partial [Gemmatimonadota bacterium]
MRPGAERSCAGGALLLVLLSGACGGGGAAGPEDPDPDPGPEPWLAKVDGPLVAKLEGEAPVAVLILSPTQ